MMCLSKSQDGDIVTMCLSKSQDDDIMTMCLSRLYCCKPILQIVYKEPNAPIRKKATHRHDHCGEQKKSHFRPSDEMRMKNVDKEG
jgi:hypothetical protein